MKVGDLVEFISSSKRWNEDYASRSPGIIIGITLHRKRRYTGESFGDATVLWADGGKTKEHISFLRALEKIR